MQRRLWPSVIYAEGAVRLLALASLTALLSCAPQPETYPWQLPTGVPPPVAPADNPLTEAKVTLGRWLFYDSRLSANQTQSCSSCHIQKWAFSEKKVTAIGSTGQSHRRNTMALVNVGYNSTHTWSHPELTELEHQHLIPLFGDDPLELGLNPAEPRFLERFSTDPQYPALFAAAFPGSPRAISYENIVKALASFSRRLVSFESPFDRYAYAGADDALSDSALRGMQLFFSERLECHHCHGGFNFSQATTHDNASTIAKPFHNTGLYTGSGDPGLSEHTLLPEDEGKFRAPTLRNIAVTAPYMHDGSIPTLTEVIEFYARGGQPIVTGSTEGSKTANPNISPFVAGFELSDTEKADLINFLESLTDENFLADPALGNPF